MTISRIEINGYQCILCGYKWISRVTVKTERFQRDVPDVKDTAGMEMNNDNE